MARGVLSPIKGLAKIQDERRAIDAREAELRREAAVEIGEAMIAAGAHALDTRKFDRIVRRVIELGEAETLKRLDARAA